MEIKGNSLNINLKSLKDLNIPLVSDTIFANKFSSPNFSQLSSPDNLFNSIGKLNKGNAFNNLSFNLDNTVSKPKINPINNPTGQVKGIAKGTGYYPANTKMEGGFNDKKGHKLNTIQGFLDGKAPYVSIALDKKLYQNGTIKYGDTFRIPELEKKYGRQIVFKAVDTGGAFTGKGFGRVDICTSSRKNSLDSTINGKLTLIKV